MLTTGEKNYIFFVYWSRCKSIKNSVIIFRKNISYNAGAKRGSKRNPYLKENDLISVKNSFLGKTTGVLKEITAPFVGIYSTKEVIEGFSD